MSIIVKSVQIYSFKEWNQKSYDPPHLTAIKHHVPLWALRGSVRCIAPVALPPSTPPRISSRRWSRENDIKKQQLGYLSFVRLFVALFCLFPFFSSSLVILVLFILFVFFPFSSSAPALVFSVLLLFFQRTYHQNSVCTWWKTMI